MALPACRPQEKGFKAHARKREHKGRKTQPGAAPLCVCAEQQEERSKEDPVSGVGKDAEQRVVKRF